MQTKENPGALAGASGAIAENETGQFQRQDTAFLAASHPIIATHWGLVA